MQLQLPINSRVPTLRSTGLKTLHRCRRKFLWAERYGLRRGVPGQALRIGTYVHIMLAARYRGADPLAAYQEASDYVSTAQEILLRQAKDGVLSSGERFEKLCLDMKTDLEKACAAVDTFLYYYPLPENVEVIGTEVPFRLSLSAIPGVILEGVIDLILLNTATGALSIVDTKTHSQDTLTRAATNVFDVQTHLFYTLGLRAMLPPVLPGLKLHSPLPEGIIKWPSLMASDFKWIDYHLIKKSTIKCCGKDDYLLENYLRRVRKWYQDETDKSPDSPPLATTRQPTRHTKLLSPESLYILQDYAAAATRDVREVDWFYKTADDMQCASLFSTCPFLDLCRTDAARGQWPTLISETYRQEFRQ